MLDEHDRRPSSDARRLHCLVEDQNHTFTVTARGDETIAELKRHIHQKGIQSRILAKDLLLLKVDVDLESHRDTFHELAFKEGDEGSEVLPEWKTVSSFWPDGSPADATHANLDIFVKMPSHDIYSPLPPPQPPLNASPRNDTVSALHKRLEKYTFIQVCGPPASGKTVLGKLLAQHVLQHDPDTDVIWVSGWPVEEVRKCGGAYGYLQRRKGWVLQNKTVFIFDDAEMSYEDVELWHDLFKTMHGYDYRRAVALTSYGSPTTRVFEQGTPREWSFVQTVILRPLDHDDRLPPVGLRFSRDEFDDLMARNYPSLEYRFESLFFDSVFSLTLGHVGAALGFMKAIISHTSYRELQHTSGKPYSWNMFVEKVSPQDLFEHLATSAFQKGLPKDEDLQVKSITRILSAVIHNGFVIKSDFTSDDDQEALQRCFYNGWLCTDTLRDIDQPHEITFAFPSPLHRWFVQWKLHSGSFKFAGLSIY